MNNDNDDNNLSIEEINDLYSDILGFPDDVLIAGAARAFDNVGDGNSCRGGIDSGK